MNNKKKIIAMLFSFSAVIIGMEPKTDIVSKCKADLNSDVVAIIGDSLLASKQWWYCSQVLPCGNPVRTVSLNGKGDILATGCDNGKVRIIDVNTGEEWASATHGNRVQALSLNAQGNGLFIKLFDEKQTRAFDVKNNKEVKIFPHEGEDYITFADRTNSSSPASIGADGSFYLYKNGISIPHNDCVVSYDLNNAGDCLATGCWDGNARIFKRYTNYTLDQLELKTALNKWLLIEKPNKSITTFKRSDGEIVALEKSVAEKLLLLDVATKCGLDYNKAIVTWKSFPEDTESSMFRTYSKRIAQHGKDGVE